MYSYSYKKQDFLTDQFIVVNRVFSFSRLCMPRVNLLLFLGFHLTRDSATTYTSYNLQCAVNL